MKWSIRRILKNGRVGKGQLAWGDTEQGAWDEFNEQQMYLCYDQYTQFVAIKEKDNG